MTVQHSFRYTEQADPRWPARDGLPTMYDLPSEYPEDPGMPDQFHVWQSELLNQTFRPPAYDPERIMTAIDLNLYYDPDRPLNYKRPDWYAVLDVPRLYDGWDPRLSFVVWQERTVPFIVVELLSPGTEDEDLGRTSRKSGDPPTKWEVYEQILGVPYYAVFSRYTDQFRVFELINGRYREIAMPMKRLMLPRIGLGLGIWHGFYEGVERKWLRWYLPDGTWIPTHEEQAKQERNRAGQEWLRAEIALEQLENEREQVKKLLARLAAAGISPDT